MAGPKEQPLPPDVLVRDDAVEILRVFVLDGGLSMAFQRAFDEPDMWGLLLVDLARHAARAYARESEYTEEDALNRIIEMFQAEIERPTDTGTTTPRGKGHCPWRSNPIISISCWRRSARRKPQSRKASCRSAP